MFIDSAISIEIGGGARLDQVETCGSANVKDTLTAHANIISQLRISAITNEYFVSLLVCNLLFKHNV